VALARILLVDDQPQLLQLIERYLKRLDYEVESYGLAQDALRAFEAATGRYDVAIVDLALPDMPGDALLAKMVSLNPDLLMLVCSGSPFTATSLPLNVQQQVAFLQKPFAPAMLVDAVAELLARRRSENNG
jgi:DNA-binding NtrC family response regulator